MKSVVRKRQAVPGGVWRVKKHNLSAGDWKAKLHKMKQIRDDTWKGEGTKRRERKNSLAFYLIALFQN